MRIAVLAALSLAVECQVESNFSRSKSEPKIESAPAPERPDAEVISGASPDEPAPAPRIDGGA